MPPSTALRRALLCPNCRFSILASFSSVSGLGFRQPSGIAAQASSQRFATTLWRPVAPKPDQNSEQKSKEVDNATERNEPEREISEQDSSLPWYLQAQHDFPASTSSPLSARQQLPDLPQDPPTNLQAILEHLSVDVGLESLSIIDLRSLNPPAALGSNLIMLFGTARSEKHLHVSADRFCRWLRSTYRFSPYADGLLGRNELKVKLRRKAKRARLLGAAGRKIEEDGDDGIRTGWVCVNVGAIDDPSQRTAAAQEKKGAIGFEQRDERPKLVVQMMTEGKREYLNLEELWNGALRRQGRKEEREAKLAREELGLDEEVGPASTSGATTDQMISGNLRQMSAGFQQKRSFHSSVKVFEESKGTGTSVGSEHPPADKLLRDQISHLNSLSEEEAYLSLGTGASDRISTPFLRGFYAMVPDFPLSDDPAPWEAQFSLIERAISLDHPGYATGDILALLRSMQESGVPVPSKIFHQALAALSNSTDTDYSATVRPLLAMTDLLYDMSLRGYDILTPETFRALGKALYAAQPPTFSEQPEESLSLLHDRAVTRLYHLRETHTPPSMPYHRSSGGGADDPSEPDHLTHLYLATLAAARAWPAFWTAWRDAALRGGRRDERLHALMFALVAAARDRALAQRALADRVPEMAAEAPPVELRGVVAEAVLECARAAGWEGGEVWRRCVRGISEGAVRSRGEV